ncbi:hypothetical protein DB30_01357 [Enhygromyxa salina]|uniref:Uncharacterized protein n=1 Tax=Enhygromyxa salina TaxID=215803 RepID=A0A0C2A4F5_9BACT|nr:hypothetical protein [Enhygromyxa salina]KIG18248.1 hypothetical protein DB30_01357 [Enhygromyxa salina]
MHDTDADEDLDEPTQPFTHAQIGMMLNEAEQAPPRREYPVDLSYFFGFGEAGTPSGMIGSHANHGGPTAAGVCGDPPRVKPSAPRVEPRAARAAPAPELDLYPWGPAPAELDGAPPLPNLPTLAPAQVPEWPAPAVTPQIAAPVHGSALEEDLRNAGLRSRVSVGLAGIAALVACGLGALVWWWTRAEPPPPSELGPPEVITMVATKYDENEDEDADEDAEEAAEEAAEDAEDQDTHDGEPRVQGRVSMEGPTGIKQVRASDTSHCVTQRELADEAQRAGNWTRLEELTREVKCWRPTRKAKVMRMNALFELGRLEECEKIGNGSNHPEIKKWMNLCTRGRG